MTRASPGPWRWVGDPPCCIEDAGGCQVYNLYSIPQRKEPADWREILGTHHLSEETAQANARLIALAPEFLAAAEALLEDVRSKKMRAKLQRLQDLVDLAYKDGCP